jgi:putative hemolysin
MQENAKKIIDIEKLIQSKNPKLKKWLPGFITRYLKRILHEDEVNQFLHEHKNKSGHQFCDAAVSYLSMNVIVNGIERIPKTGPVVITMNHPLGGMDAVAFIHALQNHRKDLKFIVNDVLMHLTNLQPFFVGVNKYGRNEKSARVQIMELFQSDHAICIFPAGLVSRKSKGHVKDLEWKKTFMTYALKYQIPILPIYIEGELSSFFYRLSSFRKFFGIKANVEMLYLANELFKQRNKTITFEVGEIIDPKQLDVAKGEHALAHDIKNKVYQLKK